jgi:hypothetical protein
MGLDMYLYRRTYVKAWDFQPPKERPRTTVMLGLRAHPAIKPERVAFVIEEVAYWRKVNAVHAWFVTNVQGGVDECQESPVSREALDQLRNTCRAALADRTQAPRLLPTQAGFFFGSTDMDPDTEEGAWYWRDIAETAEKLDSLLAEEDRDETYIYRASW